MNVVRVAVLGLGYVGFPLARAFAGCFPTIGFDVDARRIEQLRRGLSESGFVDPASFGELRLSHHAKVLEEAQVFVVAVPTPVDASRQPCFDALDAASELLGPALAAAARRGERPLVVYESTVYPGVTEQRCAPILERSSGLRWRVEFDLAYSPERINPGDEEHSLAQVVKVVAADSAEALERTVQLYSPIVGAGLFRASSIRVAEAAKVIENVQRDLNVALMNELAILFERLGGLPTHEVLAAARSKWNFLDFTPGLVGGHCVGVDPYYLTHVAEAHGYHPEVILAGRRINESMGRHIARRCVKLLLKRGVATADARVGILGLAFKADVRDLRNTRVAELADELREYGIAPLLHDPLADPQEAERCFGAAPSPWEHFRSLDALVLAVPHRQYRELSPEQLCAPLRRPGLLLDVKSQFAGCALPQGIDYWSL